MLNCAAMPTNALAWIQTSAPSCMYGSRHHILKLLEVARRGDTALLGRNQLRIVHLNILRIDSSKLNAHRSTEALCHVATHTELRTTKGIAGQSDTKS